MHTWISILLLEENKQLNIQNNVNLYAWTISFANIVSQSSSHAMLTGVK